MSSYIRLEQQRGMKGRVFYGHGMQIRGNYLYAPLLGFSTNLTSVIVSCMENTDV